MLAVASVAGLLQVAPILGWAVGWQEVLVIVIVVLILFGGRKIPELAKGLGRGLREFKREMQGVKRDFEDAADAAEDEYEPPRPKKRRKRPSPEAAEGDETTEAELKAPGANQADEGKDSTG